MPNEHSSSIILTDSDFILRNRTCAIAITADMSCRTAADSKREYKNIADTGKILMVLGDDGDGEAACGRGKPSLVLDETERFPCG